MNKETEYNSNCDHKIILTDSGLGGLAVQALINQKLNKLGKSPPLDIIFFNSLPDKNYGYNDMKSKNEKVRIFESALRRVEEYDPAMIFIVCNTLSAIFPETYLYRKGKTNIYGIIEIGVNLILQEIIKEPCNIILFGTETTIKSGRHKSDLIRNKVKEEMIITQTCKMLETAIQRGPESQEVESLIEEYVEQSASQLYKKSERTLAVFCCTHYSYSKDIFAKHLTKIFNNNFTIIDPNEKMADLAVEKILENSEEEGLVENHIYSKVIITENEKELIGGQLSKISPDLFYSFQNYHLNENLF